MNLLLKFKNFLSSEKCDSLKINSKFYWGFATVLRYSNVVIEKYKKVWGGCWEIFYYNSAIYILV